MAKYGQHQIARAFMEPTDPRIGLVLGERYRLIRCIGEGGFGAVFEAEHVELAKRFAIKVLHQQLGYDPNYAARFKREARLTATLEHQNIVQVSDFGHDDRLGFYFVMEFMRGEDLRERIKRVGPFSSVEAVRTFRPIVEAFAFAHDKGIVHRDVKTGNIFLAFADAGEERPKVLDFGIARMSDDTLEGGKLTRTGAVLGSPPYMAPEQALNGEIDARTDLYSLGIVLYEMLTGRVPFSSTSALEVLRRHISDVPAAPSALRPDLHVDPRLEAVVLRCLQKMPEQRFQSARELASALAAAERAIVSGAPPDPGLTSSVDSLRNSMLRDGSLRDTSTLLRDEIGAQSRRAGRKALAIAGLSAGLLLLLAGVVWTLIRPHGEPGVQATAAPLSSVVAVSSRSSTSVPGPARLPAAASLVAPSTAVPSTVAPSPVVPPPAVLPAVTSPSVAPAFAPGTAPVEAHVVVATDPLGGTVRWKDESGPGMATPLSLVVTPADEGRALVFEKKGYFPSEVGGTWSALKDRTSYIAPLKKRDAVAPGPRPKGKEDPWNRI